ncbi:MAG: hypothetical protein M3Y65_20640 [Pseudomonadota bacterium]|nr:hypothetical protein [Pseudomonadota bacterium]
MTDQIISRTQIRARGQNAFAAGRGREDHHMNPDAAAIEEWQAGWDEAHLVSLFGPALNARRCVDCHAAEDAAHAPECCVARFA